MNETDSNPDDGATIDWSPVDSDGQPVSADEMPPGAVIDDRYRIVGRLGAGGMGAVYRAEDRALGQEIALKFVTGDDSSNEQAIQSMLNEVRLARQVTHPNVCRVHDIGRVGGRSFITMELVDGEDLASVLRRIGRLPGAKAAEIGRQLCAGLHAAHTKGVLHRDLKPANVLLDADGNVQIADFGIAVPRDQRGDDRSTGTPAYMAPELFRGAPATVQSDLFSLGLVLYELYTGRRLFRANTISELLAKHSEPIAPPSNLGADVEPGIERVILRCLELDPQSRPKSALAVLAALPGGDPLAESLASGATPSPDLVAASGGSGALKPAVAMILVAVVAVALAGIIAVDAEVKLTGRLALPRSGEVLADRAKGLLATVAPELTEADSAYGFHYDYDVIRSLEETGLRHDDWTTLLRDPWTSPVDFRYRQAGEPLVATNIKGRVTWNDPPPGRGGARVRLDPTGRLLALALIPAEDPGAGLSTLEERAAVLFDAAGLDPAEFEPVAAGFVPGTFASERATWLGAPGDHDGKLRVEAGWYGDVPIHFRVVPASGGRDVPPRGRRAWAEAGRILLILGSAWLAYDAFRRGRGDAKRTLSFGVAMFVAVVAFTVLTGHSSSWGSLVQLTQKGMGHGVSVAAMMMLIYYALEPHVRRVWPHTIIAWNRLMSGKARDPLVGRSVLIGQVVAVVAVGLTMGQVVLPRMTGEIEMSPLPFHESSAQILAGTAPAVGTMLEIMVDTVRESLKFFMSFVLLKLLLRNRLLAGVAAVLIWGMVWPGPPTSTTGWAVVHKCASFAFAAVLVCVLIRHGLLAVASAFVSLGVMGSFPLHSGPDDWYVGSSVVAIGGIAALTLGGAWLATRDGRRAG